MSNVGSALLVLWNIQFIWIIPLFYSHYFYFLYVKISWSLLLCWIMTFGYNRSQHHREFTGEEQIHHYNLLFFIRFCSFCTSTGTCVFFHVARRSCPSFLLDSYKTVNMCSDSMNILNWCLSLWCCYSQTCTHILVPQKPDVSTCQWLVFPLLGGLLPIVFTVYQHGT